MERKNKTKVQQQNKYANIIFCRSQESSPETPAPQSDVLFLDHRN